jgi:hypothetical protein
VFEDVWLDDAAWVKPKPTATTASPGHQAI